MCHWDAGSLLNAIVVVQILLYGNKKPKGKKKQLKKE